MAGPKREPGEDRPHEAGIVPAQKPGIEVEREQAGVEDERVKPAAPDETLLPPD